MRKFMSKKVVSLLLTLLFIVPLMFLATACGEKDTKEANVAKVSTYAELVEALDGDKQTIKIEKDIIDFDKSLEINRAVTVDLNGKTLKGNGCDGVFLVSVNGDLTIEGKGNVIANGGFDASGDEYAMAIWAKGGKVTINGGKFSQVTVNGDSQYDMIYATDFADKHAEITILSGEFESDTPKWTLNLKDSSVESKIIVKGGVFKGYNPAEAMTEPNSPVNFVADGYESVLIEGTTNYKVVKKA